MISRRKLLKCLGAGSIIAPTPLWALDAPSGVAQFRQQLEMKPWLLGYRSVDREAYDATATVTGRIPAGLQGTLYRNGPGLHELGTSRYDHWFDGDGLLQAFEITETGVVHKARLVQTNKRVEEKKAGRFLYSAFGTVVPDGQPVSSPDQVNSANISVLHHHGRLFALWEAGSAHEIDPLSLETKGTHAFSPDTQGAPFSAHPRVDQAGHLWNFGYSSATRKLVLWHIDPRGTLVKASTIDCDPISMPHDFIVTNRHIVILVPPLHFEDTDHDVSFLERHRWHPDRATRVLVVSKDNFDDHFWLELPAQWVFHFGNGWEDDAGVIRFDAPRLSNPDVMLHTFSDVMRGVPPKADVSQHQLYRIDTRKRRITTESLVDAGISTEFPTIDPRVSCVRNHRLVCLSGKEDNSTEYGLLNSVSMIDIKDDSMTTFSYPPSQIPEEHLFVPAPGSEPESRGWIIGMALDYKTARTMLNIFNADALDAGPVASAVLPYAMPLGFHGKFVARG